MSLQMPGYLDYGSMMQMNPQAYLMAQQQVGLAQQFQAEEQKQAEQDTLKKVLANSQSANMDPLLLQQQRLQNEGTGFDNMSKGVKGRNDVALEQETLNAQRQKLLANMADDDLKMFMATAEKDMMSDDPRVQQSGQKKIMMSKAEYDRRMKHQDTMEVHNTDNASRERVGAANNATSLQVANIGADSRKSIAAARQGLQLSVEDQVARSKGDEQTAQIYTAAADRAMNNGDQEAANYYAQKAKYHSDLKLHRATAGVDARNAAQPDLGRLGVPVQGPRSVAPVAPPPMQRSGPMAAPAVSGGFDLGPNQERLPALVEAIRKIGDPQERANAAAALQRQLQNQAPIVAQQPAAPKPAASAPSAPQVGEVVKGYRFKGGNPADKNNWVKE